MANAPPNEPVPERQYVGSFDAILCNEFVHAREKCIRVLQFSEHILERLHRGQAARSDFRKQKPHEFHHVTKVFECNPRAMNRRRLGGRHVPAAIDDPRKRGIQLPDDGPPIQAHPFRILGPKMEALDERFDRAPQPPCFEPTNSALRFASTSSFTLRRDLSNRFGTGNGTAFVFENDQLHVRVAQLVERVEVPFDGAMGFFQRPAWNENTEQLQLRVEPSGLDT